MAADFLHTYCIRFNIFLKKLSFFDKGGGCEKPMGVANLANDIWITKHAPIRLKLVSFEPFLSLVFRNGFNFFVCYQLLVHFWPFRVKNMLKMAKKVDICQSSFQQHWKHISCKSVALEAYFTYFMKISSIGSIFHENQQHWKHKIRKIYSIGSTKNYFGSTMYYASNAIDFDCYRCYY